MMKARQGCHEQVLLALLLGLLLPIRPVVGEARAVEATGGQKRRAEEPAKTLGQAKAVRLAITESYEHAEGFSNPRLRDAVVTLINSSGLRLSPSDAPPPSALLRITVKGTVKRAPNKLLAKRDVAWVEGAIISEFQGSTVPSQLKPGWEVIQGSQVQDGYQRALDCTDLFLRLSKTLAALSGMDPNAALIKAVGNKNASSYVRQMAARALGNVPKPGAVDSLVALLQDGDAALRCRAAESLGLIANPRAMEPLIAALRDQAALVRAAVAFSLGRIQDTRATEPLATCLKDPEPAVRTQAVLALGEMGMAGVGPLLLALKDKHREIRRYAVMALHKAKDPRAVGPLAAALRDEYDEVTWAAADALGEIKDPRAAEALVGALGHRDELTRYRAMKALASIGERAVVPLVAALQHEDSRVRENAADALGRIGDRRAIAPLAALVSSDPDAIVRVAAKTALKLIRERKTTPHQPI